MLAIIICLLIVYFTKKIYYHVKDVTVDFKINILNFFVAGCNLIFNTIYYFCLVSFYCPYAGASFGTVTGVGELLPLCRGWHLQGDWGTGCYVSAYNEILNILFVDKFFF
jgi:hypothetical protein